MSQTVKERFLDILIVIAAIVLAFVIIYPQHKMGQPTRVKIAVDRSVASLPIFVAQNKGFFEQQKVIAEIVTINDHSERGEALASGEYALTVLPWSLVLEENHSFIVICSAESRQLKASESILAPPKSRVKQFADLRGKKIGLFPESEQYFTELRNKLAEFRVTKLQEVFIEPEELDDAIRRRSVDVLFLFEPYRSVAINKGSKVIVNAPLSNYILTQYPLAAFCITEDYLGNNPVGSRRIKDALEAAIGYITKNSSDAKKILFDTFDVEGKLLHTTLVEFQRLREINVDAVKSYVDIFDFPENPDSVLGNPFKFEK